MIYTMSLNLGSIWSNPKPKNNNNIPINNIIVKKTTNNKVNKRRPDTKVFWGEPTWFFFHTLAEKIDPVYYRNNYKEIWEFIKKICAHLPCPYCKNHALSYIKNINVRSVTTKDGLKNILYEFHNDVNIKTGKGKLGKEVLNKYKKANTHRIFTLFENRFFYSYIGTRTFTDWIKNELKQEYYNFCNKIESHILK